MSSGRKLPHDAIRIDLPMAEAHALLEELSYVRGGAKLPKLRMLCAVLERELSVPVGPKKEAKT